MSVLYSPVIWNRNKLIYDAILILVVAIYIYLFLRIAPQYQDVSRPVDGATIRMRAFGTCAFFMVTFILCIGPLARLDKRFLPLLYNRRHFGVLTAGIALIHANYVLGWYFAFSPTNRFVALLSTNTTYGQVLGFPYEIFGVLALIILLILAATSHDFWLSFLSPPIWKALHMSLYAGYAFIVLHIALGSLQSPTSPIFTALVILSVITVSGLHFASARADRSEARQANDEGLGKAPSAADASEPDWVFAGTIDEIQNNRGKIVPLAKGGPVAIFRYDGKLSAVDNACAHQNGPLGEGRIIDGCITCPWHGFQYRPRDGRSPAPFTEKISTYRLKLDGNTILLDPNPLPPGTDIEPISLGGPI